MPGYGCDNIMAWMHVEGTSGCSEEQWKINHLGVLPVNAMLQTLSGEKGKGKKRCRPGEGTYICMSLCCSLLILNMR